MLFGKASAELSVIVFLDPIEHCQEAPDVEVMLGVIASAANEAFCAPIYNRKRNLRDVNRRAVCHQEFCDFYCDEITSSLCQAMCYTCDGRRLEKGRSRVNTSSRTSITLRRSMTLSAEQIRILSQMRSCAGLKY